MNDWRELEAGDELDRVIAERLGFYVETWTSTVNGAVGGTLRDADGGDFGGRLNGENYWLDTEDPWGACPAFSTDLNVAWTLARGIRNFRIYSSPDNLGGCCEVAIIDGATAFMAKSDDLAFAICRAWLMWKEAQEQAA